MEQQKLPNATLILVFGILSIVGCCCYGVLGLIFGIIAMIMAGKATNIYKENPELYSDYGNVKTGKILAIIGIILSVLMILFFVWMVTVLGWDVIMSQDEELIRERMEELFNN